MSDSNKQQDTTKRIILQPTRIQTRSITKKNQEQPQAQTKIRPDTPRSVPTKSILKTPRQIDSNHQAWLKLNKGNKSLTFEGFEVLNPILEEQPHNFTMAQQGHNPKRMLTRPPTYNGKTDSFKFLSRFRVVCKSNGYTTEPNLMLDYLIQSLEDSAYSWFNAYIQNRPADAPQLTYAILEKALQDAFPSGGTNKLQAELEAMKRVQQVGEEAILYIYAKVELLLLFDSTMNIERQISYCIQGLRPQLIDPVLLKDPKSMEELISVLRQLEKAKSIKEHRMESTLLTETHRQVEDLSRKAEETAQTMDVLLQIAQGTGSLKPRTDDGAGNPLTVQRRKCFNCQSENHYKKDCPELPSKTDQRTSQKDLFCSWHGLFGHTTSLCRAAQNQKANREGTNQHRRQYGYQQQRGGSNANRGFRNRNYVNQGRQNDAGIYCDLHLSSFHSNQDCRAQNNSGNRGGPRFRGQYANQGRQNGQPPQNTYRQHQASQQVTTSP